MGVGIEARCACGDLKVSLPGTTASVAACHCTDCQRRTGSPFGVGAYYSADAISVAGVARTYARLADAGTTLQFSFCPRCGSTVFWTSSRYPSKVAVAIGAIADPDFPAPKNSLWERSKHRWVEINAGAHFPCGLDGEPE